MAATQPTKKMHHQTARRILKEIFLQNGYIKIKDDDKLAELGSNKYKRGYEIRFIPETKAELKLLRTAIASLGFYVCKTFVKHGRTVQPLYGKEITLEFRDKYYE